MARHSIIFTGIIMKHRKISKKDAKIQKELRARANWSLAVLGKSFITHGSGKFLNIRPSQERIR